MKENLDALRRRFDELTAKLSEGDAYKDQARYRQLAQEHRRVEKQLQIGLRWFGLQAQYDESRQLLRAEKDPEMAAMITEELASLEPRLDTALADFETALLPHDPNDDRDAILEIRAGTGGDEAALFAEDLARMYLRFAEHRGWRTELIAATEGQMGGFREVIYAVRGQGAFGVLRWESGVHRVQRVPVTESQGRIHTSTATVAVLAEMDDVEVEIDSGDLQIDTYRSAGAGGQNVQKNETAIRITHLPTGIVVACQDERSQLQNKLRAMNILRAKLYDMEQERLREEQDADRRSQVGSGDRSEKIRTYNYPQNRVTDHRIGMSSHNLPAILDGKLDEFIDELATREEADRLQAVGM